MDTSNIVNYSKSHEVDLKSALSDRFQITDKLMSELYDHNVYGSNDDFDQIKYSGASGGKDDVRNKIKELVISDISMQKDIVNHLNESALQLQKSYNKSSDAYRNQRFMNNIVKKQFKTLKERNHDVLQGMDNKKRQIEINNYHYKKNKAQVSILYNIIYLSIAIYVLHFLNENFSTFMPDLLYASLVGLGLGLFALYLGYALYDIYLRDNTNFDEYTMHWTSKRIPDKKLKGGELDTSNDFDFSICKANANEHGDGLDMEKSE